MRVILKAILWCGAALTLMVGTSAAAASSSTPSAAAQSAYVNAVHTNDPSGTAASLPTSQIVALGEAVCTLFTNGKSLNYITGQLGGVSSEGKSFPAQFVSAVIAQAPMYLCLNNLSKVLTLRPKSKAPAPSGNAKSSLMALLPSGLKHCDPLTSSQIPTEMTGIIASAACDAPQLGAKSSAFAYEFDNAADYATSLKNLNAFKEFVPTSPPVGCPISTSSADRGANQWGNNIFPPKSGQILECEMTAANGKGANNIPDFLWTLPTKRVIFEAEGDPGSTMQHLDAWWKSHSG
jgi:hypothetical protein